MAASEGATRVRADGRPEVLLVRSVGTGDERRGPHRAATRHWEAIYTITGEQAVRLRGVDFVMDAHSLMVFRNVGGTRHDLAGADRRRPRWEALHACFDPGANWSPPGLLDRIGDEVYRGRVTEISIQQRIRDAFGRLLADARERVAAGALPSRASASANGEGAAADVERELMLITLREILLLACKARGGGSQRDARVQDALARMAADLTAAHTLRSLGRATHLSPSRFAHLFRAETGVSPVRALRLMRLRQAKLELLYTDDTVEQIAESTGFTSSSHLGREFRREFGVSPRTFRAQARI